MTTIDAINSKLQPISLGYSNVGVIVEAGVNVEGFEAGDRVVLNGLHADMVKVPQNLCARIPDTVDDDADLCRCCEHWFARHSSCRTDLR